MRVSKKQLFLLLVPMLLGTLIFLSWYSCQEHAYDYRNRPHVSYSQQDCTWKTLDYAAFRLFNGSMQHSTALQIFWGLTNHRLLDLVAALWMTGLFCLYYILNPRKESRVMIMRFGLYIVCIMLAFVCFTSSPLAIKVRRFSPTMTEPLKSEALFLSQVPAISWKVKDTSSVSFPGDHALVLLIVGSCLFYLLRSGPFRAAVVFGIIFFSLPRLAGGGHWLSDVLVGSVVNYAIFYPVVMFAPIRERMLALLQTPALWCHHSVERALIWLPCPEKIRNCLNTRHG